MQKITVKTIPAPDSLGRLNELPNIFDLFIYGAPKIAEVWADYNDKLPAPTVTVTAYLKGRNKYDKAGRPYNNITLEVTQVKFNY